MHVAAYDATAPFRYQPCRRALGPRAPPPAHIAISHLMPPEKIRRKKPRALPINFGAEGNMIFPDYQALPFTTPAPRYEPQLEFIWRRVLQIDASLSEIYTADFLHFRVAARCQ